MSTVYTYRGKRFNWKASVHASLIDPLDKCTQCGGSGRLAPFASMFDENDGICSGCGGSGTKYWMEPFIEEEVPVYLQKCLDKYLVDMEDFKMKNPPFLGAYI